MITSTLTHWGSSMVVTEVATRIHTRYTTIAMTCTTPTKATSEVYTHSITHVQKVYCQKKLEMLHSQLFSTYGTNRIQQLLLWSTPRRLILTALRVHCRSAVATCLRVLMWHHVLFGPHQPLGAGACRSWLVVLVTTDYYIKAKVGYFVTLHAWVNVNTLVSLLVHLKMIAVAQSGPKCYQYIIRTSHRLLQSFKEHRYTWWQTVAKIHNTRTLHWYWYTGYAILITNNGGQTNLANLHNINIIKFNYRVQIVLTNTLSNNLITKWLTSAKTWRSLCSYIILRTLIPPWAPNMLCLVLLTTGHWLCNTTTTPKQITCNTIFWRTDRILLILMVD